MPLRLEGPGEAAVPRAVDVDLERAQYKRSVGADGRRLSRRRVEGCSTPRVVLAAVFVGAVVAAFVTMDQDFLVGTLEWMRAGTVHGPLLFVALYCTAVVLLVPGTVLALCAGAMYKWEVGTLLVWVGQSLGQLAAFCVGRYLLRDAVVANVLSRYRGFAAVDAALEREGWKLVVLLRLSPIVPWNVLNYLLSTTGVGMVPYAVASSFAVLPWLSLFAYVGSMAHTLADVLNGNVSPGSGASLLVGVVSGVLLVTAVLYTGYVSKRAISEAFRDGGGMLGDDGAGGGGSSDSSDDDEEACLITQGSGMDRLGAAHGTVHQSLELADIGGCDPTQAAAATAGGEAVGTSSSAAAWVGDGASFRSWLSSGNAGAK